MKIHLVGDLHIEFMAAPAYVTAGPQSGAIIEAIQHTKSDVLVLAGDISNRGDSVARASMLAQGRPVILVGGNHEFYLGSLPEGLVSLENKAKKTPNVHFLENRAVEIGGVVFLGCTLWTDMRLFEPRNSYQDQLEAVQGALNDYRLIKWQNRRELRAADTVSMHKESVEWLQEQFEIYRGRKIVVVTHHAPSLHSIAPEYLADIVSAGFASNLKDLVETSGAALWIHGHTHGCSDYMIGQTRVVANCCGYPFEQTGFNPCLVVDI